MDMKDWCGKRLEWAARGIKEVGAAALVLPPFALAGLAFDFLTAALCPCFKDAAFGAILPALLGAPPPIDMAYGCGGGGGYP